MSVSAELASLRELHTSLGESTTGLRQVASTIEHALDSTVWTGQTLERLRAQWTGACQQDLSSLVECLEEARVDLRHQHNNLASATGQSERL